MRSGINTIAILILTGLMACSVEVDVADPEDFPADADGLSGPDDAGDPAGDPGADPGEPDAGSDAGPDAGPDAGWDAGWDAGGDEGPADGADEGAADQDIPDAGDLDGNLEPWPPLSTTAGWFSQDSGYGTGLGFADIDGDGDGDLVVAYGNDMERDRLVVYTNDNGILESTPSWQSGSDHYYGHLSIGDVNGDGWPDVAVSRFLNDAGWFGLGGVEVFINQNGTLQTSPAWEADGFCSFSCALGDLDLDGDLDLAVAVGEAYSHQPRANRVFTNDGTGDFGSAPHWTSQDEYHSMDVAWADFDNDGWLDLAFANHDHGHTLYSNNQGVLGSTPSWTSPSQYCSGNTLDFGDVNGDGWLDLVISENDQQSSGKFVRLWCGPGLDECWRSPDVSYLSAVSLEDLDGDGDLDLAAGAWFDTSWIYLNQNGLQASPGWHSQHGGITVEAFAWEDLDGSHWRQQVVSGQRLVAIPGRGRVLSVTGGVAGFGYVSGPGPVSATYLEARARDLAVSDWEFNGGNHVYLRE